MEPKEVILSFYDTLANSGPEAAAAYLADDYTSQQPNASAQGKAAWLAAQKMWRSFFPDLALKPEVTSVEGNTVYVTSNMSGTNTGDLDLESMGLGFFKATGKSMSVQVPLKFVINGDKIVFVWSDPGEEGGLPAILAQLGIDLQ